MAGITTDIFVASNLIWQTLKRRLSGSIENAPDLSLFSANMQKLLDRAPANIFESYHWVDFSANQPPWLPTQVELQKGDNLSCFSEGRIYANKALDIYVPLSMQIWFRVGQGDIFRGTQKNHSFEAQDDGVLQLGNYFPNDWKTRSGDRTQDDKVYGTTSGEAKTLIIKWAVPALEGLRALRELGDVDKRLSNEIDRLERGQTTPLGWSYLWNVGPSDIYQQRTDSDNTPCINCHTRGDAGILQKSVDLPLNHSSEISWRWCMHNLASQIREDSMPSHDYLSIAVEFDNGRDITYYWSNSLAPGTGYDCPLPNWKGKEYHVVVRSGELGLGTWLNERRNLYEDYQFYMGEPPARIVKVWLIANSIFQRGDASCDYSDIVLTNSDGAHKIL